MGPLDPHGPWCGAPAAPPSRGACVQMLKRQYEVNIGKTLVGRVNLFLLTTNVNFNCCLLNNTHLLKKTVMKYNISKYNSPKFLDFTRNTPQLNKLCRR